MAVAINQGSFSKAYNIGTGITWRISLRKAPRIVYAVSYTHLDVYKRQGNFIYERTSAESFRMMAALMDAGLPLAEYARRLFRVKELPFVRLLGQALPCLLYTSRCV